MLFYTLWRIPKFSQTKGIMNIQTIVVSFISVAFVVVKLKIFKVLDTNLAPMMCPFPGLFRPLHPQIWYDFAEIFTRDGTLADKNSLSNLSKI